MNYHNITSDDMLNGDGLRVVLWVSGCSHHCPECQNPSTWDENGGIPFDEDAKKELFEKLAPSHISGVTISGGDPLHPQNRPAVEELLTEIKLRYPQKTVWLYTGYKWDEIDGLALLKNVDILVDGKYVDELRDTQFHWKGSSNQNIIRAKESLERGILVYLEEGDGKSHV